jgi:hypothetical protein
MTDQSKNYRQKQNLFEIGAASGIAFVASALIEIGCSDRELACKRRLAAR